LAAAEESFGSSGEYLPKLGKEFLDASIVARHRERRNRQGLLATALVVFVLLAIAASVAAMFAFWQKGEAEKAVRSAKEQAAVARKAEDSARAAQKATSEVASPANVFLARNSIAAGDDAQALAHGPFGAVQPRWAAGADSLR
jgi:hypothetical protein